MWYEQSLRFSRNRPGVVRVDATHKNVDRLLCVPSTFICCLLELQPVLSERV
jgi:hypothetical protein